MVEVFALNKQFNPIAIFDSFESILWVERYDEYSEFEVYTPTTPQAVEALQVGNFLWRKDSKKTMIIEKVKIETDAEIGSHMTISGRSLESLLDRRIVWTQTIFDNKYVSRILFDLVNAAFAGTGERAIPGWIMNPYDASLEKDKLTIQFTGDNIYEIFTTLCNQFGLGFKVELEGPWGEPKFRFSLFKGVDRTYDQLATPFVIFSPKFDNLVNTSYLEDTMEMRSHALVMGEGEGEERKRVIVDAFNGKLTGMDRRELYVDARDLSQTKGDETIPDDKYNQMLAERGAEYLSENVFKKNFEGGVDPLSMFRYDEHYYIGDIVQIQNEYGMEAVVRVSEVIRSNSSSGEELYPTFRLVKGGDIL